MLTSGLMVKVPRLDASFDRDARAATESRLNPEDRSDPTDDLDDSSQALPHKTPTRVSNDHADVHLIYHQPSVLKSPLFPIHGGQNVIWAVEYCKSPEILDMNGHSEY